MSTRMTAEELLNALKDPFPANVVHWRVGNTNKKKIQRETGNQNAKATKGQALTYINSRDVMKRLDDVCGIDGWQVRYPFEGCCELSIKMPDGTWITKANGAGKTDIEGEKGIFSDAFKRAATMFGIGRYLYYLPSPWVDLDQYGKFTPPALPAWALPKQAKEAA